MTLVEMQEILEGLTDDELGQHLSDLTYEVIKHINNNDMKSVRDMHEQLVIANNEWEYRNQ
jgi:hypothetical protein